MSDYLAPTHHEQPERRLKIVHLVFGVIYLGIVGVWMLGTSGTVNWGDSVRYLAPIVLVVAGGIGLAAALLPGVRRRSATPDSTYATDSTAESTYSENDTTEGTLR